MDHTPAQLKALHSAARRIKAQAEIVALASFSASIQQAFGEPGQFKELLETLRKETQTNL